MSVQKIRVQESVEECVEQFIYDEIRNIRSVSQRMEVPLHEFITRNYPGSTYSFLHVNGDVSLKYIKDNIDRDLHQSITNRHLDSFIKNVDVGMNKFFDLVLNEAWAA